MKIGGIVVLDGLRIVAATAVLILANLSSAFADKNIALVIGNSVYRNVSRLPNAANDATAMAKALKEVGFGIVESRLDLGVAEMKRALRDFSDRTKDADVALVYFAGHGIEVDGTNYLLPVDARLERDLDVEDEGVSLDRVLRTLDPAKRLRLVILDACRDNPFASTMKLTQGKRSVSRGLARVEPASSDTLVAFAAKAGSTAAEGNGPNSPFTTALLKHIATPGLDLRIAFGRVRDDVLRATNNRQEPFVYGSLGGDTIALVPPPVDPNIEVRRDFEVAAQMGTKQAWESFLAAHPSGFYGDLARAQRATLQAAEEASARADEIRRHAEEQAKVKFEEFKRQAAEQAVRQSEEERRKLSESTKREIEDTKRKLAEQMQRELDAARRQVDEAKRQANDARVQVQTAKQQAIAEAKLQVEEANRQASLAQQLQGKLQAAEQASAKADEVRRQTEAQAQIKLDEIKRQAAEQAARQTAEEKRALAENAKREIRNATEKLAEQTQRELNTARRQADEARRQADEARQQLDAFRRQVEDAKRQLAEDAKRKAEDQTKVAALSQTNQPELIHGPIAVVSPIAPGDMERLLQAHLKRVGCDPGSNDGKWDNQSKQALAKFNKYAGTMFDINFASLDTLNAVRAKTDRVCPLSCAKGQHEDNGRCVQITCSPGLALGDDGACHKRPGPPARAATRSAPQPAKGIDAGKCFTFNGKRFCE